MKGLRWMIDRVDMSDARVFTFARILEGDEDIQMTFAACPWGGMAGNDTISERW